MYKKIYNVRHNITMLVTNRGIVIIMTNPQKTVFLIKKSCIYTKKRRKKKEKIITFAPFECIFIPFWNYYYFLSALY